VHVLLFQAHALMDLGLVSCGRQYLRLEFSYNIDIKSKTL